MADSTQDRQIVVATDQMHLVLGEIDEQYVEHTVESSRLGLTLVTLTDVDAAVAPLAQRRAEEFPHADLPEAHSAPDRVLRELRAIFEGRYAGWCPTMGKNRTLTGVQFEPYTHGGFDKPTPAAAESAFAPAGTARRVRVGLLDTRLAPHTRLTGRCVADNDALMAPVESGRQRLWWEGHSTFIAGLIQRDAPATILDVRTALRTDAPEADALEADATSARHWTMSLWDFAARLGEYQDAGVAVINLSVGLATTDNKPPLVLERAIAQLTPSVVVVAAAGNHGSAKLSEEQRTANKMPARGAALFPAALDNVLAVGALHDDLAAEFTPVDHHTGGPAPWIDVFAPGVELVSTYLGDGAGEEVLVRDSTGKEEVVTFDGWAAWSGSSFAAGVVTAAVANLLAEGKTPAQAVAAMRERFPRPKAIHA